MAENLTDVDEFTATIQMPENGEGNSASVLRDMAIQRLANRTRNAHNRLTAIEDGSALIACYRFSGSSIAVGSDLTLNTDLVEYVATGLTPSAGVVTIPRTGIWKISGSVDLTDDRTNNPQNGSVSLRRNSSTVAAFAYRRDSADTAVTARAIISWVQQLDSGDTIRFRNNNASGTISVVSNNPRVILEFVSD